MSERSHRGLIAHWPFTADCHEHVGTGLSVRNHGVQLSESGPRAGMGAASFDGATPSWKWRTIPP